MSNSSHKFCFIKPLTLLSKMSDDKNSYPLPQLLVMEAIRELEKRFSGISDREKHVFQHVLNLGKKPGFSMVSQLLRQSNSSTDFDTEEDVIKFIGSKLSVAVFGIAAKCSHNSVRKEFELQYTEKLPNWFSSLVVPGKQTPQHDFWIKAYAYFLVGVFTGAFLHFGYKATLANTLDEKIGKYLCFTFKYEKLTGTWEFSSNN